MKIILYFPYFIFII